jgi:hypothetical protein
MSRAGEGNLFGNLNYCFMGQTILPEARLYYYKARVYDPHYGPRCENTKSLVF